MKQILILLVLFILASCGSNKPTKSQLDNSDSFYQSITYGDINLPPVERMEKMMLTSFGDGIFNDTNSFKVVGYNYRYYLQYVSSSLP